MTRYEGGAELERAAKRALEDGGITITVCGLPAPQGSKKPVRFGNGKIGLVESSKKVAPWREAVRAETQRAFNGAGPIAGPVSLTLTFGLSRPQAHYRTGRYAGQVRDSAPLWPGGRPDLDKLVRAVLDGLTEGGAWADDSQVAWLWAQKTYSTPGCVITIRELGPAGQRPWTPDHGMETGQ